MEGGYFHNELPLALEDVRHYLSMEGWFVRNTYDFDCKDSTGFWYVIKDTFGGMEELSANTRSKIRRCFKTLNVRKISAAELIREGYQVYLKAAESYRVKTANYLGKESFDAWIDDVKDYWGCYDKQTNHLVAFSVNVIGEERCEYQTLKAIPDYMRKHYAYYGLLYEMNRYYLEDLKLKYVSDGARSITNHSNIQPFLIEKFHFRKAFCHLKLYYKFPLSIAVKLAYPFRKLFKQGKVASLLNMEAMQRGQI